MLLHHALNPGRAAVITGAASGIGLAAAERLAGLGMKVCLVVVNASALEKAPAIVAKAAGAGSDVIAVATDVSKAADVERLRDHAFAAFGEVAVLMNNAGIGGGGVVFGEPSRWRDILEANLWGVIHGVYIFAPMMLMQGTSCAPASKS